MIGEDAVYPSRSELIRVAVRDFLIRELESAQQFIKAKTEFDNTLKIAKPTAAPSDMFVQIPITDPIAIAAGQEFKTYRIIKK